MEGLQSLREISEATGIHLRMLQRYGKALFPHRFHSGMTTMLTWEESKEVLSAIQRFRATPSGEAKLQSNYFASLRNSDE
jgi:hypothetical protein